MRLRLREDAPGLLTVEYAGLGTWGRRLLVLGWVNAVIGFLLVPSAAAKSWFCYIPLVCEAKAAVDFATDPLGFLLQKLTEANIWFLQRMLELIQNTTKVDLGSEGFLKQYALVFAASSFITAGLWFIACIKRAVRGVPITEAVGEAIGFLLLQFFVTALTPGAIALLMTAIDEVTAVFEPYATNNFKPYLENTLKTLAAKPEDGVGQLLVVNLIMLCGALLMWVELLIRSAAIYVAVALGPVVTAGLVDRDLWGKSKKWIGAVFAIGLTKPVLFALLGLGGAILSDSTGSMSDAVSKTLVGALILLLAVFASATLYRWVPAFGDEMAQLHHDRKTAQSSGPAAAVDGPAQHANRALGQHIQDSLVGGGKQAAPAPGRKAATSSTVGQPGTASAKDVPTGVGTGETAATPDPIGIGVGVAKAGLDAVENRAAQTPATQSNGSAHGGPDQESAVDDVPASARAHGGATNPIISADTAAAARSGSGASAPHQSGGGAASSDAPASSRSQGGSAPVIAQPTASETPAPSPPTAPTPPALSRPAPPAPAASPSP
ncbi:hypothetical protein, partial [Streptomyces sp. UNOC14_S4]|uniref:hypothetical protein n=1 Tax=Streptomyces sp. UNOC14_S4 TaxID=2872340 RepID=UPI001E5BBE7B